MHMHNSHWSLANVCENSMYGKQTGIHFQFESDGSRRSRSRRQQQQQEKPPTHESNKTKWIARKIIHILLNRDYVHVNNRRFCRNCRRRQKTLKQTNTHSRQVHSVWRRHRNSAYWKIDRLCCRCRHHIVYILTNNNLAAAHRSFIEW